MAGKVFLNYRRDDDAGTVGRLFDRLEQAYGRHSIFMDVEGHIKAGDDYVDVLRDQVAQCDVLLAVIGPRWLSIADETGRRRLDNPEDWVRVEIASALQAGSAKRVIPILVPGGAMPRAEDLPPDLAPLARKQAVRITLERFNADTQGLVTQIAGALEDVAAVREASAAERRAAEELEKRRAEEETARLAAVEARGREQRAAGMSTEDVRKAEELANWDFIKESASINEMRDHLARFPGGVTARYATSRLEDLVWAGLDPEPTIPELQRFLAEFPNGAKAGLAKSSIENAERVAAQVAAAEREQAAATQAAAERKALELSQWAVASASDTPDAYQSYLRDWPDGEHVGAARARQREISRTKGWTSRHWAVAVAAVFLVGLLFAAYSNKPDTIAVATASPECKALKAEWDTFVNAPVSAGFKNHLVNQMAVIDPNVMKPRDNACLDADEYWKIRSQTLERQKRLIFECDFIFGVEPDTLNRGSIASYMEKERTDFQNTKTKICDLEKAQKAEAEKATKKKPAPGSTRP